MKVTPAREASRSLESDDVPRFHYCPRLHVGFIQVHIHAAVAVAVVDDDDDRLLVRAPESLQAIVDGFASP